MNVNAVVLNCQKYNECLNDHKSLGLIFEALLFFSLSLSLDIVWAS